MKIKKFRIKPRLNFVGKHLKSLLSVKQLPSGLEESLPEESQNFASQIVPVAFYQTFSNDDIPSDWLQSLKDHSAGKAVAVSALIATIGSPPEEKISALLLNGETQRAQVITALSEESADLAFQFLFKLLVGDAASDDCEVSAPVPVTEAPLLADVLTRLDAGQESVHVDSAAHLTPRFTRVALVAWIPVAKRKKIAAVSKKKGA